MNKKHQNSTKIIPKQDLSANIFSSNQCVHRLFEAQVKVNPNTVAINFQQQTLTYKQLNQRSNQLARYLKSLDNPPQIIGIFLERSLETIIAILGILKAGAAYLPLNPQDLPRNIDFIIKDAEIDLLLTEKKSTKQLPIIDVQLVCLDTDCQKIALQSTENLANSSISPQDLAYIIYTADSTGRPKGTMIEHRSVVNLSHALDWDIYQNYPQQLKISLNDPISLDTSVKQIIQLLKGHSLYIVSPKVRWNIELMIEFIRENQLDILDCTPSYLKMLLAGGLIEAEHSLKAVIIDGKVIDQKTWNLLRNTQQINFYNLYGVTECTVSTAVYWINTFQAMPTPTIGRSLLNTQIYILDQNLQAVPIGVTGELYLGGAQIARGYLNRPELMAEKFIINPFDNSQKTRLYKTGHLGRYLAKGNIEYIGQVDNQIKLSDFSSELGEVCKICP